MQFLNNRNDNNKCVEHLLNKRGLATSESPKDTQWKFELKFHSNLCILLQWKSLSCLFLGWITLAMRTLPIRSWKMRLRQGPVSVPHSPLDTPNSFRNLCHLASSNSRYIPHVRRGLFVLFDFYFSWRCMCKIRQCLLFFSFFLSSIRQLAT